MVSVSSDLFNVPQLLAITPTLLLNVVCCNSGFNKINNVIFCFYTHPIIIKLCQPNDPAEYRATDVHFGERPFILCILSSRQQIIFNIFKFEPKTKRVRKLVVSHIQWEANWPTVLMMDKLLFGSKIEKNIIL